MSMDAEDLKTGLCPQCETLVETHAPGASYVAVDGMLFHPGCTEACEEKLVPEPEDLGERVRYHLDVIDVLTRGINATRADVRPLMDEEELDEMVDAYEAGEPARTFALRLCNRDVRRWENARDPYPQRQFPTAEND